MGGGMTLRSPASRTDADARVTALVRRHGASLMKTASAISLCADDAHDAYQRALEIYLRRLEDLDPLTEAAYMRVVVRNEALAVRRQRQQQLAEPDELDARAGDVAPAEERLEREQRVQRAAEVLRDLKPDEARALLLQAQGHSYDEIGRRFGWTYTKVNRSVSEGRKRFKALYAGIETGDACDALAPVLAAVAAGTAGSEELLRLRPHLRHCARCRAEVRRLHGGALSRVAGLLPLGLLDRVRAELAGLMARFAEPLTAGAATGGGRGAAVAAVVAVCLGGIGAGCVVTGVGPGAPGAGEKERPAAREAPPRRPVAALAGERPAIAAAAARPTPVATATPAAARPSRSRARTRRPVAARSTPTPAPRPAPAEEFGIETPPPAPAASAAPAPVAAAPATAPAPAPAAGASFESSPPPAPAPAPGGDFGFEG